MLEAAADSEIARAAVSVRLGSILAAAGCGKTEQIAIATLESPGRRLILTHSHAGVDVLRQRLKKLSVPRRRFRLETIAGWCLRYASSFPTRSGLQKFDPRAEGEWNEVYRSGAQLISSGAIDSVLSTSYSGVFVDEYQDCSLEQHNVVTALSRLLPVCVFGDPLQAIFDFKGQRPVDWATHVYPTFAKAGELTTPWRWKDNSTLAVWLKKMRRAIESRGEINLAGCPDCVRWEVLPVDPRYRTNKIVEVCKRTRGKVGDGTLVVIADAASIGARAHITQKLAKVGFSQIEPIGCTTLYNAAKQFENTQDMKHLMAVMKFIGDCMTGSSATPYLRAVEACRKGLRKGTAEFGSLIDLGVALLDDQTPSSRLALLEGFYGRDDAYCFRREMYHAMRAALLICISRPSCLLTNALWEVQSNARHAGRIVGRRCVGSTLLVKGLEFDHSVLIHAPSMTRKDWYVALTRASKTLTLLVPAQRFSLASDR
ncbi:UvrD-helicase domain-containing protein [Bradyrhizobium sp. 195]|uniref:UvrD-helicase domain-containing protein n=1 Tax=Bradyrhizobium sp. 195 TaxID=2782662 RepID=UPI002000E0BA|nr:UvrD-helicase domain-containing protein [Bradyrhizobium sp. 195]UPK28052.1 ATP-dependent helicase [Bradyrhizobium sp. 195]